MMKYFCKVCGMIINENNFNYNKEAFIDKNTMENIIRCPFCGASEEYIINRSEEFLNKKIEGIDKETNKILDHAMKLEVFNGDFYRQASLLAKDINLKEMFKALSNIEYMHARIHKSLIGIEKLPNLREMDYSKYHSDEILVQMANKREKHAVQYYRKYYNDLCNDKIREIFDVLSLVEKEHIELTK
ncbi:ferritin family protein [Clostridium cochlearium]|uniref:ferritin family protein n=1 Tax=Clostridium cochlearium TaxID=1494 RepID=UPI001459DD6B|nr:ferritin family protein [Clostridium cochlearium]NSJ90976.1 metal-iron-binding protein [Coprococcus sp. MSK.21.13]MBE6064104.1 metal-iron-binding protein [Clostridium cochlearium]MCG4572314.1 metal-iron-binding protein [Clostridium cochlearium]MCG4578819.1 metal-iron-binding protein [Clostridium cochlearium]MDU1443671.1 ferritin family protein [Clostridium cochlearium]